MLQAVKPSKVLFAYFFFQEKVRQEKVRQEKVRDKGDERMKLQKPVRGVFFDLGWTLLYPVSGD